MNQTKCVEVELPVRLVQSFTDAIPVGMKLRYVSDDPYALHVTFQVAGVSGTVEWVFSRDLLADGLEGRAGEGDVRIWPATVDAGRDVLYIALSAPAGSAVIEVPVHGARSFLHRTVAAVPQGAESEQIDVDEVLANLLTGR
ncbi:SsgA family sporulation/cell division regulator [Streptomyces cadmiisoli]|uniref:SsgA family sporulation/cell division regulator n=1 Tax=Streptomyces cadmiisoli TaxID=2184053 RepID=UPI003D74CC2C